MSTRQSTPLVISNITAVPRFEVSSSSISSLPSTEASVNTLPVDYGYPMTHFLTRTDASCALHPPAAEHPQYPDGSGTTLAVIQASLPVSYNYSITHFISSPDASTHLLHTSLPTVDNHQLPREHTWNHIPRPVHAVSRCSSSSGSSSTYSSSSGSPSSSSSGYEYYDGQEEIQDDDMMLTDILSHTDAWAIEEGRQRAAGTLEGFTAELVGV